MPSGVRWLDAAKGDSAEALAKSIGEAVSADDDFADRVYRVGFQTFMAGQLFVRSVELAGEPGAVSLTATRDAAGSAFLAMPFEDALAFFESKQIITPAEFDAMRDRYRAGGFVARRLASERMELIARDLIARLLSQDLTIDEVRRSLRDAESEDAAALGVTPASSAYLETVVRTNVATAYGHGRWLAMNDPAVVALRPYMQIRTAGDSRVRANHAALNGVVLRLGTDEAAYYATPLGFNCRCVATSLSQRQVDARGLAVTDGRIAGIDPDKGWAGAPAPLSESDT